MGPDNGDIIAMQLSVVRLNHPIDRPKHLHIRTDQQQMCAGTRDLSGGDAEQAFGRHRLHGFLGFWRPVLGESKSVEANALASRCQLMSGDLGVGAGWERVDLQIDPQADQKFGVRTP